MEPRIQYAQTKDGVSIAFWTLGEGTPIVWMPAIPISHVQLEWQLPFFRFPYESIAESSRVIRYDSRGTGLSDRNALDFSLQAQHSDLQAVVDRLNLEKFVLLAPTRSGQAAIAFAADHPENVSKLILMGAYARTSDYTASPKIQALAALLTKDWLLYNSTAVHFMFEWSEGEEASQYNDLMLASVSPEAMLEYAKTSVDFDVTHLLPSVMAPTLVVELSGFSWLPVEVARGLASRIPDSRLAIMEPRDYQGAVEIIREFLADDGEAAEGTSLATQDVHTILFTDVEGSTALTQRLGDAKARDLLREHERIVREALKSHGGSEVKTMGDGFMASFSSATKALECAIAMQRAFAQRNSARPEPVEGRGEEIRVRIGLNAGEPIAEDEDLFGTAVNLAARICAHAEAGQILVPIVVRELTAGKRFLFADLGETELRGYEDAVRLYEVSWRESG